ncbi:MAG: phosphotransferase [Chitinophagaceae bacterium]|nr:phosphotransferase [Anaerolineae bacterium]
MWIPGQSEVNRDYALLCASLWDADAAILEHLGDFGNSVYSFYIAGEKVILRLTDPKDRSQPVNEAELDFLLHLHRSGVQANIPITSLNRNFVETVIIEDIPLLASVFTYAPGVQVDQNSIYWQQAFFKAWGKTLAQIHQAASTYEPAVEGKRWHWIEEDLIANARHYIPKNDTPSLQELDTLIERLHRLPINRETYGLIHADLGARNFHYDPQIGITVFDFGNCCYHWFISDIAIALSTLRHYPKSERDQYHSWIIAGYEAISALEPDLHSQLSLFIRLRILYVYLDRLMLFGAAPTESQKETLFTLRQKVHEGFEW